MVTLAAAPACYVQSGPVPPSPPPAQTADPQPQQPGTVMVNPPPPSTNQPPQQQPERPPVVIANPPPPSTQPSQPTQQPPVVIANPPPPSTKPTRPDPRPTAPTTTPAQSSTARWTVYQAKDGSCMAAIKVECQPKATCNPPPPFKVTCPQGVSLEKPITVATYDGTSCFVEYETPACPPKTACNPPRPQPVACPKR
ncbi:MAG TPA: hypothetical protein VFS15_17465 [Kofleriaceae bacterium]|nr:hypothetical protein [Kofleriaceae bacterium]